MRAHGSQLLQHYFGLLPDVDAGAEDLAEGAESDPCLPSAFFNLLILQPQLLAWWCKRVCEFSGNMALHVYPFGRWAQCLHHLAAMFYHFK